MRWILGVVAFVFLLAGVSGDALGDEGGGVVLRPKQQCIVFCRRFDEANRCFTCQIHSLGNGESVAAAPDIEIAVDGIKADGATIDVSIGQAKSAAGARKATGSKAATRPDGDGRKKHVVQFVKFNKTFVIPLGGKLANGATPRVEVLIGAGDVIHWNWTWESDAHRPGRKDAEREAVFKEIAATGFARILCERGSPLKDRMGAAAYDRLRYGLDSLQEYCVALRLHCYGPHRWGLADVLDTVSPYLDYGYMQGYEDALFGRVGEFRVELIAGSALMQNMEALGRLPEGSHVSVIIYTKRADDRLLQAVKRLRVRDVSISDADVTCFWDSSEEHAEGHGTSPDEWIKMVSVNWQVADAAIPAFKKLANLEEILILAAAEHGDEARAREMLKAVQKALPKAEAHLVFYGVEKQPKRTPAKDGDERQSRSGGVGSAGQLAAGR